MGYHKSKWTIRRVNAISVRFGLLAAALAAGFWYVWSLFDTVPNYGIGGLSAWWDVFPAFVLGSTTAFTHGMQEYFYEQGRSELSPHLFYWICFCISCRTH